MKKVVLDVEYLGFGGLMWYPYVAEIAWTPWDIVIEKIAEKVEIGRFYAFLYTKNAVFLHKKLKNDLELIEGHPVRF